MQAQAFQDARDMIESAVIYPELTQDDIEERQALSREKRAM